MTIYLFNPYKGHLNSKTNSLITISEKNIMAQKNLFMLLK